MANLIQSLWVGEQLSNVERLCIQSFIDNSHDFHLYAYEEIKNIPAGTIIHNAEDILPKNEIFRVKGGWGKGSVSGFADLFRLLLLQKNGGWWVDMDVICLKRFDCDLDTVLCSSFEGEYGSLANNCVIKAPKNSAFLKYCLDHINSIGIKNMTYGMAGPFLFQKAVKELGMAPSVVPFHHFNPIAWRYMHELILGRATTINKIKECLRPLLKPNTMMGRKIHEESYSIHLWNEMWQRNNFDKNGTYSATCIFERLKRKHQIS